MSARMVRTVEELRALDTGALVRDSANVVFEKWASGWYPAGPSDEPETPSLPATVLAPAIDPDDEVLIEKVARAIRRERAFVAGCAFGVPSDAIAQAAEIIARAAVKAVTK